MAEGKNYRIQPAKLNDDIALHAALKAIPDYQPANKQFTLENIEAAKIEMERKREAETQAENLFAAARDDAAAAEWEYHNLLLGAKDQVKAQYGKNSNEIQAMGLKKSSERKPRERKAK